MVLAVVAPRQEVEHRITLDDRFEDPLPPCGVGRVLVSAFRHGEQLSVFLRDVRQQCEVSVHLFHEVSLRAPLVCVLPDDVHAVVSRVAFHPCLLCPVTLEVWRVCPHDALFQRGVDIVLRHVPQRVELAVRAVLLSPPEPRTVVLVPGAEDDGNGVALLVFQRGEEVRDAFQPFVEERMTHAAGYDSLHRMLRVGYACRDVVLVDTPESVRCGVIRLDVVLYPCRGAEHGVARMPRDGDDAAPCMMVDDSLPDACEGHGIEVLQVALLYTSEVEAHHGGVVAHQLVCVRASLVPVPCDAVERVVLMTVHIPALL